MYLVCIPNLPLRGSSPASRAGFFMANDSAMKKKRAPTVDFLAGTFDDIERHGMELLVFDAPELSAVLRGHMLIERVIEALISGRMRSPSHLLDRHRLTFELKADLASALGVVPDTLLGAAKALNNIRNAYAHREDHRLTFEELNSLKIKWVPMQKKAYEAACTKGEEEAARIAIIFLYWEFLKLLPQAEHATT